MKRHKKLGDYTLQMVGSTLRVYKNGEQIIGFYGANLSTFKSVEELEEELALQDEDEYEDEFGNYGEGAAARHDLMVDANYCFG